MDLSTTYASTYGRSRDRSRDMAGGESQRPDTPPSSVAESSPTTLREELAANFQNPYNLDDSSLFVELPPSQQCHNNLSPLNSTTFAPSDFSSIHSHSNTSSNSPHASPTEPTPHLSICLLEASALPQPLTKTNPESSPDSSTSWNTSLTVLQLNLIPIKRYR